MKYKITILIMIILLPLVSCKSKSGKNTKDIRLPIEVLTITKIRVQKRLFAVGDLKGIEQVNVYPFKTGLIKRQFVVEGQKVFKGQPLFSIDQTNTTVAMLDHVVRSPINGIVYDISVDIGSQVIATKNILAKVVKTDFYKVNINLPNRKINEVKIGQKAIVELEDTNKTTLTGTVTKISHTLDSDTKTLDVEIHVKNANGSVKSGMFAKVNIITGITDGKVLVPQECVLFDDNVNYVYKYDKNRKVAVKQIVKIGKNYSGYIVIKHGIKVGEEIIKSGQYNVYNNYPVKLIKKQSISSITRQSKVFIN